MSHQKQITDYTKLKGFERKQGQAYLISVDETLGIVEHIVAVTGNIDMGGDRIVPGAFTKTILERAIRIKCLDQHYTDSVTRIVGKPLEMRELTQNELPVEVREMAPTAQGGLYVKTQYALDTARGKDVFALVKGGYAPEASIGYDPTEVEFISEKDANGKSINVRNLKQLRLWEYSNVVFGMNPGTAVLTAKGTDEPDEIKPYGVVEEDGKWRVYKLDDDGNPTGDPLGEHDTEEDANAQVRALYASETTKDAPGPNETKVGKVLNAQNVQRIKNAMKLLTEALANAGALDEEIQQVDDENSSIKQAGPGNPPPTSNLRVRRIEIEEALQNLTLGGTRK
jgi:HK97 family phage prohead protease